MYYYFNAYRYLYWGIEDVSGSFCCDEVLVPDEDTCSEIGRSYQESHWLMLSAAHIANDDLPKTSV